MKTSGSGKSTFARKYFLPTEVVSSDACRAMVSDEENNLAFTNDAFAVLHFVAAKRLALGPLTVIDATNVQPEARKPLVATIECVPLYNDRSMNAQRSLVIFRVACCGELRVLAFAPLCMNDVVIDPPWPV